MIFFPFRYVVVVLGGLFCGGGVVCRFMLPVGQPSTTTTHTEGCRFQPFFFGSLWKKGSMLQLSSQCCIL